MDVKNIMTPNPVCCTPESKLQDVAKLMVEHDCGCIPVVESSSSNKPVGMITDRDITIRTVAEGHNPLEMTAAEAMTPSVITITPETSVEDCCDVMEKNQIRRVAVVDENGDCCGMVAQADVAIHAGQKTTGEVVQEVSKAGA